MLSLSAEDRIIAERTKSRLGHFTWLAMSYDWTTPEGFRVCFLSSSSDVVNAAIVVDGPHETISSRWAQDAWRGAAQVYSVFTPAGEFCAAGLLNFRAGKVGVAYLFGSQVGSRASLEAEGAIWAYTDAVNQGRIDLSAPIEDRFFQGAPGLGMPPGFRPSDPDLGAVLSIYLNLFPEGMRQPGGPDGPADLPHLVVPVLPFGPADAVTISKALDQAPVHRLRELVHLAHATDARGRPVLGFEAEKRFLAALPFCSGASLAHATPGLPPSVKSNDADRDLPYTSSRLVGILTRAH